MIDWLTRLIHGWGLTWGQVLFGVALSVVTFVAFSSFFRDVTGQLFVFIVMTVAAAEAAVGLGIIIAIFRSRESLDVDDASNLKF